MMKMQVLPVDLQLIIVDFLSIDDCYALQEADQNFLTSLHLKESFWAKKVFEKHIQYMNKSLNMFKFTDSPIPYYIPTSSEFNNFKGAKTLWEGLIHNQNKLNASLAILEVKNERIHRFNQRIYTILADPLAPLPSLKRETQCIPTSSCFENFLTEVHFNISSKSRCCDENFRFLEEVCDIIEGKPKEQYQISDIFEGVQNIVRSHCKIMQNYLLSLTDNKVILKEYRRCWKQFTYSMIELNDLTKSYENLLNVYTDNYVSAWKEMVQIWVDEVYNKIAFKLKDSFLTLLMDVITKEVICNGLSVDQRKTIFNNNQIEGMNCQERDQEKTIKLLLKSFIAFSDISLCKSDLEMLGEPDLSHSQPKLKLINYIYPKIKNIIETAVLELHGEPSKLSEILNTIKSVLDTVSNEEISLEKISKDIHTEERHSAIEKNQNFVQDIAGQYKIVSKCKWENRLSDVYQSMIEPNVFY